MSPRELLGRQRSHILVALTNAKPGNETSFLKWYQGAYRDEVLTAKGLLSAQHYKRHEVDITMGRWPPPPYQYVGLYEISVDGAQAAVSLIDQITASHAREATAFAPATWLYYVAGEKVGRAPAATPSMVTLAFANPQPGREAEFREWYTTRHIRHALSIPAFVSGQCFERACFQKPGAMEAIFATIAVYEQEGTPQEIIKSLGSIPDGALEFPSLDASRFGESVYVPLK
jgi:hypothetical protein